MVSKLGKLILFFLILWLVLSAVVLIAPYFLAESAMREDTVFAAVPNGDGTLRLSWTASPDADRYSAEVWSAAPGTGAETLLFRAECAAPECILPAEVSAAGQLEIRIGTLRDYYVLWFRSTREGSDPAILRCDLSDPRVSGVQTDVDPKADAVTVRWDRTEGDRYCLYLLEEDGSLRQLRSFMENRVELSFGPEGDLPLPLWGETVRFALDVVRSAPGLTVYGTAAELFSVQGKDLFSGGEALSPLYATVWPVRKLSVYEDTEKRAALGTVEPGAALCVLAEEEGLFRVRTEAGIGYVDSALCMIDLTDYLGELCVYDITNSYSSIFTVHGYAVPELTGTVVSGYESVRLADGSFVVPLLYPTAQKLASAARAVFADGFRLKIYDSFRPNTATRAAYDLARAILTQPLPETTVAGDVPEDLPETNAALRYQDLINKSPYNINSFLASSGSMHNFGIAVDLTLEALDDGEELQMQTAMHDLSWYSIRRNNGENAELLSAYMEAAGLAGISSEWWHFQDDERQNRSGMLREGVSVEGWKYDGSGWRYRRADGTYCAAAVETIDGTEYRFDENGYTDLD